MSLGHAGNLNFEIIAKSSAFNWTINFLGFVSQPLQIRTSKSQVSHELQKWLIKNVYLETQTFSFVSLTTNADDYTLTFYIRQNRHKGIHRRELIVSQIIQIMIQKLWSENSMRWCQHNLFQGSKCCGYGSKGTDTKGYDCLVIPGAAKTAGALIKNNAFCGQFGLVTTKSGTTRKTICSESKFMNTRLAWTGSDSSIENHRLSCWQICIWSWKTSKW